MNYLSKWKCIWSTYRAWCLCRYPITVKNYAPRTKSEPEGASDIYLGLISILGVGWDTHTHNHTSSHPQVSKVMCAVVSRNLELRGRLCSTIRSTWPFKKIPYTMLQNSKHNLRLYSEIVSLYKLCWFLSVYWLLSAGWPFLPTVLLQTVGCNGATQTREKKKRMWQSNRDRGNAIHGARWNLSTWSTSKLVRGRLFDLWRMALFGGSWLKTNPCSKQHTGVYTRTHAHTHSHKGK